MNVRASLIPALFVAALLLPITEAEAGQIVQSGSLSGLGAPTTQQVPIDAFDDVGGTLQLTQVTIEAFTSMVGGYTTDGSGVGVTVVARLIANYSIAGNPLVNSLAELNLNVPNNGPLIAVTVFDNDNPTAVVTDPTVLAAFVGTGTVDLDVFTEFLIQETPSGVIFFGAGGSVDYTVTYDFEPAPPGDTLVRGDTNDDGTVNIADAVFLLAALFSGGEAPSCADAADGNDDGLLNIADAVTILDALFGSSGPLPAPAGACGQDPTDDALDCADFASCP